MSAAYTNEMVSMTEAGAATATEQFWFLNTVVTVRVRHVGSRCSSRSPPPGDSPPLHRQTEDEIFHLLEGRLRLRAGEADVRIGAGETMLAPKGVAHTYRVESPEGATRNGDFERFVRAVGRPAKRPELPTPQGPPTPEQADALAAAARAHGIELVGPPLDS
jgi:mannose-6-phosphate isomerase-like protein (cupin superfamily)